MQDHKDNWTEYYDRLKVDDLVKHIEGMDTNSNKSSGYDTPDADTMACVAMIVFKGKTSSWKTMIDLGVLKRGSISQALLLTRDLLYNWNVGQRNGHPEFLKYFSAFKGADHKWKALLKVASQEEIEEAMQQIVDDTGSWEEIQPEWSLTPKGKAARRKVILANDEDEAELAAAAAAGDLPCMEERYE